MLKTKSILRFLSLLATAFCLVIPYQVSGASHHDNLKKYIQKISISKNNAEIDSVAKIALKAVDTNQDLAGKTEIYLALGEAYYNQAHPNLPKIYFDKAYEIANKLKSPLLQLKAHRNIARVYNKEGKYYLAIEHFIKSLDLARQIKQPEYIFMNYISLSISYNDQNKPDQSLIYSNAAISDSLSIPNIIKKVTISSLYMCIGRSYWQKKEMKLAEQYTIMAIRLAKENDVQNLKTKGWAYSNLGDIYKSENRYNLALKAYNNALKIFGLIGGEFGFQRVYIAIAETFYLQGKQKKALTWAFRAYTLARKINICLDIKNSAKLIADIYSQQKEYEKAYKFYIEYTRAKDTLNNIESMQRILELQTKYETQEKENLISLQQAKLMANNTLLAKRQAENKFLSAVVISITALFVGVFIGLLRSRRKNIKINEQQAIIECSNRKLQEQKANLEQINEAKNRLFSIIGHDLISQVGTTKEFLSLLTKIPDGAEKIAVGRNILEALYATSISTYALLENLLTWSKNERGLISYIPIHQKLKPVIEEAITGFIFQAQKKRISIDIVGNCDVMAVFDQNIIATVLRNLVANAIKFSNEGERIIINITNTPTEVYISVIDKGVGINSELVKAISEGGKISSKLGTESEKGNGLGLSLCCDLIKMHGKKLEVSSVEGEGSTFTFSISKKTSSLDL